MLKFNTSLIFSEAGSSESSEQATTSANECQETTDEAAMSVIMSLLEGKFDIVNYVGRKQIIHYFNS